MTDGELDPTQAVPLPGPDPDPTQMWQRAPAGSQGPPPRGPQGPRPPQPDGPDRRPWILVGVLAAIVLVLLLILLLQGGDDGGGGSTLADGSTTTTVVTSTTPSSAASSTSTTPPSTTATTTAPVTTVDPATCKAAGASEAKVGQAAQAVYEAWVRGDEGCAHELLTDAAFDELFSRDGSGADEQLQGCTKKLLPAPHTDCAFTYEGGATHYLGTFDSGWRFYDIEQVAD